VVKLLHVSAFLGHHQGGIQRRKINYWPATTEMFKNTVKTESNILSTVHAAYSLLSKTATSNSQCRKPYAL
jgi:hypothetical protein